MNYGSLEFNLPWRTIWEYVAALAVGVAIGALAAPILLELLHT